MASQKTGLLFEPNVTISPAQRARVESELRKIGKILTFKVFKDQDGWMAQCNEVEGIIAGGTNSNPTHSQITSQIRESIYAAFSAESEDSSYFSFEYTLDGDRIAA